MRITNKVAKWIVIIYTIVVFAIVLLPLSTKAKEFPNLSQEAKEKYITNLTERISKELDLQTTPKLYFYNSSEWAVIASYYDGLNYIYVNLGAITSYEEATRVMAHEIRHDYQYEHMNDNTEYGRALRANQQNYISYYEDLDGYKNQFIEKDAEEFAANYVGNVMIMEIVDHTPEPTPEPEEVTEE